MYFGAVWPDSKLVSSWIVMISTALGVVGGGLIVKSGLAGNEPVNNKKDGVNSTEADSPVEDKQSISSPATKQVKIIFENKYAIAKDTIARIKKVIKYDKGEIIKDAFFAVHSVKISTLKTVRVRKIGIGGYKTVFVIRVEGIKDWIVLKITHGIEYDNKDLVFTRGFVSRREIAARRLARDMLHPQEDTSVRIDKGKKPLFWVFIEGYAGYNLMEYREAIIRANVKGIMSEKKSDNLINAIEKEKAMVYVKMWDVLGGYIIFDSNLQNITIQSRFDEMLIDNKVTMDDIIDKITVKDRFPKIREALLLVFAEINTFLPALADTTPLISPQAPAPITITS